MVFKDSADTAIPELAGLQRKAAMVGGAAAVGSLLGLLLNPTQFLQSCDGLCGASAPRSAAWRWA